MNSELTAKSHFNPIIPLSGTVLLSHVPSLLWLISILGICLVDSNGSAILQQATGGQQSTCRTLSLCSSERPPPGVWDGELAFPGRTQVQGDPPQAGLMPGVPCPRLRVTWHPDASSDLGLVLLCTLGTAWGG